MTKTQFVATALTALLCGAALATLALAVITH